MSGNPDRFEENRPDADDHLDAEREQYARDIEQLQKRADYWQAEAERMAAKLDTAKGMHSELQAAMVRIRHTVERIRRTQGYAEEQDWLGPFLHAIEDTVLRPSVRHEVAS